MMLEKYVFPCGHNSRLLVSQVIIFHFLQASNEAFYLESQNSGSFCAKKLETFMHSPEIFT